MTCNRALLLCACLIAGSPAYAGELMIAYDLRLTLDANRLVASCVFERWVSAVPPQPLWKDPVAVCQRFVSASRNVRYSADTPRTFIKHVREAGPIKN